MRERNVGVMCRSAISTMAMASQVYIKLYQMTYLKYVQLSIYTNVTSKILLVHK